MAGRFTVGDEPGEGGSYGLHSGSQQVETDEADCAGLHTNALNACHRE